MNKRAFAGDLYHIYNSLLFPMKISFVILINYFLYFPMTLLIIFFNKWVSVFFFCYCILMLFSHGILIKGLQSVVLKDLIVINNF